MNLWVIFLTGLTVGGLTCLAVQGGLLASVIAAREEADLKSGKSKKHTIFATIAFLAAKLLAYTMLGFLLGSFGGAIGISQTVQITMQLIAGFYMIAVALNLLEIHPIFRYVVIQPPRFLARLVRNQSKSKDLFAPAILGVMTIFIPCGTTLAMEALAISSANPFTGAAIMATFVFGTMPLFFGIGLLTSVLGDTYKQKFLKMAGIAILYLGITSANGALNAAGSPITLEVIAANFPIQISLAEDDSTQNPIDIRNGAQETSILVTSYGYQPNKLVVKKGIPVKLNLVSKNAYSCALAFRMPTLGIAKNLTPNGSQILEFTPTKTGRIPFSCSMGMYTGVIDVI